MLWILGEYVESVSDIQSAMQEIRKVLGEIPILASEQKLLDDAAGGAEEDGPASPRVETGGGRPRVLADGTYATETAFTSTSTARLDAVRAASKPPLRSAFLSLYFSNSRSHYACSLVTRRGLLYRRRPCFGSHEARSPFRREGEGQGGVQYASC